MIDQSLLEPIESVLRQAGAAPVAGALLYAACILLACVLYRSHGPGTCHPACWLIIACFLTVLGASELLGLPAKALEAVRLFSIDHGWYTTRRTIQVEFILALAVMYALSVFCILPRLSTGRGVIGVTRALGMLPVFIIIRASSLHALDYFLRLPVTGCLRMNGLIEISIICLILWQLIRAYRISIPEEFRPASYLPPDF